MLAGCADEGQPAEVRFDSLNREVDSFSRKLDTTAGKIFDTTKVKFKNLKTKLQERLKQGRDSAKADTLN